MLAQVEPNLLLIDADSQGNDSVRQPVEQIRSSKGVKYDQNKSEDMHYEGIDLSKNQADFPGEYARAYHSNDSSDSVTWENIQGVIQG